MQQLMEDWAYEQDTGHINALAEPPQLLSVQILRFERNRMGEISKLESIVQPARLQVACFRDGVDAQPAAYDFRSAVYHIGHT